VLIPALLVSTVVPAQTTEPTYNVKPVVIRAPGADGAIWYVSGGELHEVFSAMGHAVAGDRLWQIETSRRQARGTLSELLPAVEAPTIVYSEHELQALFESLDTDYQAMVSSYVDGINRRIAELAADPSQLPVELEALGMERLGEPLVPAAWTATDVMAWAALEQSDPAAPATALVSNEALIETLAGAYPGEYLAMFGDLGLTVPSLAQTLAAPMTPDPAATSVPSQVMQSAAATKVDYWLGGAGGDIYYSSGDVGVGTSTPDSVFHAKSSASSIMLFEGTSTVSRAAGVIPEAIDSRINFIGYTSPSVATAQTAMGGFQVKITDADPNALKTELRFLHNSGDTITEAMLVADDSSVAIGVSTPSTKLEVGGVITATGGNSTQWNTAYGWGDHSTQGYLTSESDPVYSAAPAATITSTNISNWNTAYGWGNHAAAGYDTTDDSWTGTGGFVTTPAQVGIGVAGPPITWLDLVVNTPPGIPHMMIDQPGPGDAFEWFTLSMAQLSYSEGIDAIDSNFKITNTPVLTGGAGSAQGDGITMMQTNPAGIVDLNNQSRARAFLTHIQGIPFGVWTPIEFDDDFTLPGGYDQQGEFTLWVAGATPATFIPTVAGYYQVNARTEYEFIDPVQPMIHGYVSIAIFINGTAYAEGNNLQMIDSLGHILHWNNAPNVSDVLWLVPGDVVDIRALQMLDTIGPVSLIPGTHKTYVSIHKVS
jgi:hypothetical protein